MTANKKTSSKRAKPWEKGMKSPNPRGRPKGIADKRTLVTKKLLDKVGKISDVVIEQALAGDLQAADLILKRTLPVLSSQAERVQFNLDVKASLSVQSEQVLVALSTGKVSADIAKQILETIGTVANLRQLDEIENRIIRLEADRVVA